MLQRVIVGRFTRETNLELHDVLVMPTGRTYYRRNMGEYQGGIPPGPGALVDLRKCINLLKDEAVHHLQAPDMFSKERVINTLAERHHCSYATQRMDIDPSAL